MRRTFDCLLIAMLLHAASAFGMPSLPRSNVCASTGDHATRKVSPLAASSSTTAATSTVTHTMDPANWELLSDRGRAALERIMEETLQQSHVYGDWPPPGTDDDGKRRLAEQVRRPMCDVTNANV